MCAYRISKNILYRTIARGFCAATGVGFISSTHGPFNLLLSTRETPLFSTAVQENASFGTRRTFIPPRDATCTRIVSSLRRRRVESSPREYSFRRRASCHEEFINCHEEIRSIYINRSVMGEGEKKDICRSEWRLLERLKILEFFFLFISITRNTYFSKAMICENSKNFKYSL